MGEEYGHLPGYTRELASRRSHVDVGCMRGVDGEYAFVAEEAGRGSCQGGTYVRATPRVRGEEAPTQPGGRVYPGRRHAPRGHSQGGRGRHLFCAAGVLYCQPAPVDLLVALRRMCGRTLILRTSTFPEVDVLGNADVYFPMLRSEDRRLWGLRSPGVDRQVGIACGFETDRGHGNWFWGLTPVCLEALLKTAGFLVEHRAPEAFGQILVCNLVAVPFEHRLPYEAEAREVGRDVSVTGEALPH